ncbi:NAD-dependent succinate-semialdehyde dehydrogenase [Pigmentiphaga sp. H8]|uniref:NAD-dependent succinate-semialdehyde dehydrogenase n=1 Tax=Pigmentiphaga sp. H8 TaxID=2488560 RepID=UPI000F59DE67|nr:NAD-dependent succinate-semialdehyde dehydrogenase [Pigmentiphaga sp. H8]AZG09382.1 NAD-dependent succinate-semialdehyde dehydrogenase [Pigmentiphaga sp. H8]
MNYPDTRLFIANQWQDAADGRTLPVVNPATGTEIGRLSHAGIADLDRALLAARQGFDTWRNTPAAERARLMRRAAALLRERAPGIAAIITREQGKPLAEAKHETSMAAEMIEWFADEALRVYGRIVPSRVPGAQQLVLKVPAGPVAAFTPWNFPINQATRKIAAALAAGCSIILKAAEETPAAAAALFQAFADAGVPPGVIGLVYGNPAQISAHLIAHPAIRLVSFTGSTPVGKQLAALAGRHMKRVTMELGGHAPVIVADDADIDLAIRSAGAAKFRNAGQVCIAPTRFLVHDSIRTDFASALSAHARSLRLGDGLASDTQMGPLANPRRLAAMAQLTEDAVRRGASIETGGERLGTAGNFWTPTVLTGVPQDARLLNEEPFGPIATIQGFATLEEAIAEANRLPYGLAAYAYTRSLKHAHQLTQHVQAGMLWINQPAAAWPELPFGGVKDSGYGSDGGPEALEAHLDTRLVSVMNV